MKLMRGVLLVAVVAAAGCAHLRPVDTDEAVERHLRLSETARLEAERAHQEAMRSHREQQEAAVHAARETAPPPAPPEP
jgi:hypothetical protein